MINVKIINNASGLQTHGAKFDSTELANQWIDSQAAKGDRCAWGKPARSEEIRDEEGNLLEVIEHEAEYTVVIEDISTQVQQEEANRAAREYLASTDWYVVRFMETGVEIPEEVSQARQDAREVIS